jgi:hypothetical protein
LIQEVKFSTYLPQVLLLFQSPHQQLPERESIIKSQLNGRCLILNQPLGVSTDILEIFFLFLARIYFNITAQSIDGAMGVGGAGRERNISCSPHRKWEQRLH